MGNKQKKGITKKQKQTKSKKERLDKLMMMQNLAPTRGKAQALIMAGSVQVNGERADKAGTTYPNDALITVTAELPYASRGGYKLAGALESFGIDVTDRACADVGACTGGFTDVLLQNGARRVFAMDVGYGQLAWHLRQNERVTVLERTNVRYVESLAEPVAFASVDVSFISLKLVIPAIQKWLTPDFDIVALIKPQFEAGRKQVGKGGIVKDPAVHGEVLHNILGWAEKRQLSIAGLVCSSIKGSEGNVEFLVWLRPQENNGFDWQTTIAELIEPEAN